MKLDKKNFLTFAIIWFLIAYLVMWFLGGACLNIFVPPADVNSVCISHNALQPLRNIPLIGLLIPYNPWVSLFYWFAPIAGFFLAFFGIQWWNNYFETKEASKIFFPILLLLILFLGYFINLNWYYLEVAMMRSDENIDVALYTCFDGDPSACREYVENMNQEFIRQYGAGQTRKLTQYVLIDYWSQLRASVFLTFIFGALAAWIPFFVKDFSVKKKKK